MAQATPEPEPEPELESELESAPERIHWLQRSMAGVAALLAAAAAAWGTQFPLGIPLLLPFLAVAWTLFVRDRQAFRSRCLVVGAGVTVAGVLLVCIGMFVMIPSGVILLLARSADPRRRPVLARVYAGLTVAAAATLVTAGAPLAYDVWLKPSHSYSVEISGDLYGTAGADPEADLWQYGVTGISESGLDSGTRLRVTYDEDLDPAGRAALREALARMPGAGPVKECGRGDCD
ncbi:hypothetical protein [Streptomyces sp. NBC_00096]|uniref:hypothetical protein n=1 Tax=Streptomyces sp. NBC_00096 TaxID=2975650 RepID=UPI0032535808